MEPWKYLIGSVGDPVPDNSSNADPNSYWTGNDIASDWWMHQDSFAHNEALAAWNRESTFNAAEAEKARQFEKMMSDTQFQRKVQDYLKAGFSPLAALEGNGSYQVGSAPAAAAHAQGARNGANSFGGMLGGVVGALMMTLANVATHGASVAASRAGNAAKAALDAQKLDILHDQVEVQKGWLDLARNGRRGVDVIAAQKALRKASHGHGISDAELDKILDDLDNL